MAQWPDQSDQTVLESWTHPIRPSGVLQWQLPGIKALQHRSGATHMALLLGHLTPLVVTRVVEPELRMDFLRSGGLMINDV